MYYLITIVITGVASSLMTMYLPSIKSMFINAYKRIVNVFKRKPREVVPTQTPNYITREEYDLLIQQINTALVNLDVKTTEAVEYAKKRDSDRTSKTKQIVLEYLKELQK